MASDLDLLRSFLAVYRAGSITKAAPRLNLTQPAVSAHVRALEARVNRPLFVRSARGTQPTQAAHDLSRRVAPHVDALGSVLAPGAGDPLDGATLYVGGPAEFLAAKVLPALAPLVERGLHVRVQHGLPGPLMAELADGIHDLVVATRRVNRRGVEYEVLYREEFVLVGTPRWAAEATRGRMGGPDPRVLAQMPLIAYSDALPVTTQVYRRVLGSEPPTPRLLVPDLRAVCAVAQTGAGIAAIPRYLCEEPLERGALVELARSSPPVGGRIHLAWRQGDSSVGLHAALHVLRAAALQW